MRDPFGLWPESKKQCLDFFSSSVIARVGSWRGLRSSRAPQAKPTASPSFFSDYPILLLFWLLGPRPSGRGRKAKKKERLALFARQRRSRQRILHVLDEARPVEFIGRVGDEDAKGDGASKEDEALATVFGRTHPAPTRRR